MSGGDRVVLLRDPLMLGEMIVLSVLGDGRLLCEEVNYEEGETPIRGAFDPLDLELLDVWQKALDAREFS